MFVCILLLATFVIVAESSKNITIKSTFHNSLQTDTMNYWTETQKLFASDGDEYDYFGYSVSLNAGNALIGASYDDENGNYSGSAYVFILSGTTWIQQQKLLPLDGMVGARFGESVSLDGDTALIGAQFDDDTGNCSGSAYVFTRTGTIWTQQAKLLAPDGEKNAMFGCSVSLDGDTALIGAYHDNDNEAPSGSAYVFIRNGTTWTFQTKLLAPDGARYDSFGCSVSLSNDTALIGARWDNDTRDKTGSAYVFIRTRTNWTFQAKLLASDGADGDSFGLPVYLSDDTALVGTIFDDDKGTDSGSAYVFIRTGTTWTQQAKLLASDGAANDNFGNSISLGMDTALIGAWQNDENEYNAGSVYVFKRTGTTWSQQQKLLASDGSNSDVFGCSVSLDDDTALIGAYENDNNFVRSGSVYVFKKEGLAIDIDAISGLGVNAIITNYGIKNVNGVNWQIQVKGGLLGLINKTVNGTIDIAAGESKNVKTDPFIGLGPITITVKAADNSKTREGIYLFIFSIVKTSFPWKRINRA